MLRFVTKHNGEKELTSIDDYVSKMKEGQEKIYFIVNPSFDQAIRSPYFEPFKENKQLDVIILTQ